MLLNKLLYEISCYQNSEDDDDDEDDEEYDDEENDSEGEERSSQLPFLSTSPHHNPALITTVTSTMTAAYNKHSTGMYQ